MTAHKKKNSKKYRLDMALLLHKMVYIVIVVFVYYNILHVWLF